jgi:hypothetical protein
MKSGDSGLTALLGYNTTVGRHFQTVALYEVLHLALFDVLFNLCLVLMIVTEGFIDLGRGQVGQALEDLLHAEPHLVVAYN